MGRGGPVRQDEAVERGRVSTDPATGPPYLGDRDKGRGGRIGKGAILVVEVRPGEGEPIFLALARPSRGGG